MTVASTNLNSNMSSSSEESLYDALEKLNVKSKVHFQPNLVPDRAFKKEIEQHPFKIFKCIADLGYYGWHPEGPYKNLTDVTACEIMQSIDIDMKPPIAESMEALNEQLPKYFASLPPQEYKAKYPHMQPRITPLYVSVKHRGVKIQDVDFLFGGTILEVFANKAIPPGKCYIVTVITGTDIILVAKDDEYIQNYSDHGFQFERLVTGKNLEERHDPSTVHHLQLMEVSGFCVLFAAEVDAMDDHGKTIEITKSNPKWWGTSKMFQMISNGSTTLYSGVNMHGKLIQVEQKSLSSVIRNALRYQSCNNLEENILECMQRLKKSLQSLKIKEGHFHEISFDGRGLALNPLRSKTQGLLPPNHVIEQLLL